MTRHSDSVPEYRTSTRPLSPNSDSTLRMASLDVGHIIEPAVWISPARSSGSGGNGVMIVFSCESGLDCDLYGFDAA